MFAVLILDPYCFTYLADRETGVMQLSRFQRDVLTHRSTRAVSVCEAKQVIFMARRLPAAAVTLHLLQNFRYVLGHLIGFSRPADKH